MFVNFNILNQLGSPAINSNTFANRPAAGQTGRLFVSTDTFEIYRDNGTSWDLIGGPGTSTITGSGTATQVAYFTGTNAIGSSANLFWDNTNGYLGVGTATPGARIEAVKTDGYGIYANYTTSAGSGATTTGIYSINNTAGSGYAAVIEERTGNTAGGQYPLLVKHSLSSGTAAVGNGTGLQFQLQDDAGTFKTTQLTIETIDAAAATYASRYRFNVQSAGSSTPAAYLNATGLGLGTATPGAKLDIHSTGTLAQLNSTGATNNGYLAFQRAGTTTFSIGDTYNGGSNYFRIYSNTLAADVAQIFEATGKTSWQATQTYTTGLARGNYFDYNVSVAAGGSFSSPNSITALGGTLDLTLAGNATIPSGARSGLDAYNTVSFTGTGTLTHSQGTQIRAYSNLTTGWAFAGSATGTITHLAGLRVLFPDNSGSAVTITNNYGLLINDQTANTGTVTYTNRWGIYQEAASDTNYFAATTLVGTTVNSGYKFDVSGSANATTLYENGVRVATSNSISGTTNKIAKFTGSNTIGNSQITDNGITIGLTSTQIDFGLVGSIFQVYPAFSTNLNLLQNYNNGSAVYTTEEHRAAQYVYKIGLTQAMTLDASGYLGVGVTPSAGSSGGTFSYLGVGNTSGYGIIAGQSTATASGSPIAAFSAVTTGASSYKNVGTFLIELDGSSTTNAAGRLTFYTADGSGNQNEWLRIDKVGLSTFKQDIAFNKATRPTIYNSVTNQNLHVKSNGSGVLQFNDDVSGNVQIVNGGGNVLIGTTTDAGYKLNVLGRIVSNNFAGVEAVIWGKGGADAAGQGRGNFRTSDAGGTNYWDFGRDNLTTGDFVISEYGTIVTRIKTSTGKFETTNSIKTGAPNTGTAAEWKLGSRVAATVALDTTQYIQLDVGGTLYKLAIVT